VGYGCTTCIGNSGPLPEAVAAAITGGNLIAASVLSGNRNFEGRINPHTKANYLASPALVIAYAIAGRVDIDLEREPLSIDDEGEPVFLSDIWPTTDEVKGVMERALNPQVYRELYGDLDSFNPEWNKLPVAESELYGWRSESTYIQEPPFFMDLKPEPEPIRAIANARVLALLGDTVTTDHISPAGTIPEDSPAGQYLIKSGIEPVDFNSFGSRRGNDRIMVRGTFGNIRLKNQLLPGSEGGVTRHMPSGEKMWIYDAAVRYERDGVPLIVLAGAEYGTGSSRDWAAKGTRLLGIRAIVARSYERIHRSNLIGMGVLPLQFKEGDSAASLGLDGRETYNIAIHDELKPLDVVKIEVRDDEGGQREFEVIVRLDTPVEITYYRHGGILQTVLRQLLKDKPT
jgi:aconitate hydratase